MESRLGDYHIDEEARAAFREAFAAHDAGLYRCVCRLLFPEIERMIGAGDVGSKKMLEELTGAGDLADFAFKEPFDYVLFRRLVHHAYAGVKTEDERVGVRAGSGPQPSRRHAWFGGLFDAQAQHEHADPDRLRVPDSPSARGFQHVAGEPSRRRQPTRAEPHRLRRFSFFTPTPSGARIFS